METAVIANNTTEDTSSKTLSIKIELGGGVELLFDKTKAFNLDLPLHTKNKWTLQDLIFYLRDNRLEERPELFMQDNSVRPGILVLVNDSDWELMDTLNYELQNKDRITFISTLHGG